MGEKIAPYSRKLTSDQGHLISVAISIACEVEEQPQKWPSVSLSPWHYQAQADDGR